MKPEMMCERRLYHPCTMQKRLEGSSFARLSLVTLWRDDFSIPGRVTSSPVLRGKNKNLTASIKNVFLWPGMGNICRNESDTAAPVWDKSCSNWEARHECGFEVLLLFEWSAVVAVTCLWLFNNTSWKRRWAIFFVSSVKKKKKKKVLKDTFIKTKRSIFPLYRLLKS